MWLEEIWNWFTGTDKRQQQFRKRVFISFAVEDRGYRNYLVQQARKARSPFDLIDMSVKKAWDNSEWKNKCRTRIKGCDCLIVLLSNNTWHAGGARWEIRCALEEGIPVIGMHIKKNDKRKAPPELNGCRIIEWTWENLEKILKIK